jgi:hypothetical protein
MEGAYACRNECGAGSFCVEHCRALDVWVHDNIGNPAINPSVNVVSLLQEQTAEQNGDFVHAHMQSLGRSFCDLCQGEFSSAKMNTCKTGSYFNNKMMSGQLKKEDRRRDANRFGGLGHNFHAQDSSCFAADFTDASGLRFEYGGLTTGEVADDLVASMCDTLSDWLDDCTSSSGCAEQDLCNEGTVCKGFKASIGCAGYSMIQIDATKPHSSTSDRSLLERRHKAEAHTEEGMLDKAAMSKIGA